MLNMLMSTFIQQTIKVKAILMCAMMEFLTLKCNKENEIKIEKHPYVRYKSTVITNNEMEIA
jgi:hypothetical protein